MSGLPATVSQPAGLTVGLDAGGTPLFDFAGHLHAQGLDLDAATYGVTPPEADKVRWIRASDGGVVAYVLGTGAVLAQTHTLDAAVQLPPGVQTRGIAGIEAIADNGGQAGFYADLSQSVAGVPTAVSCRASVPAAPPYNSAGVDVLTQGGNSDFCKLATLGDRMLDFGSGSVAAGAVAFIDATFFHNMNPRVPQVVFWATDDAAIVGAVTSRTSTQITLRFREYQAVNLSRTINYRWLALG